MFDYPTEIFGAKMREEKFGNGEEHFILYCYDIYVAESRTQVPSQSEGV